MTAEPYTFLRIPISDSLLKTYEKQAAAMNQPVEQVMALRLAEYKDHSSYDGRMLVLTPSDRQEIESNFNRSFASGSELARVLSHSFRLRIDTMHVQLSPALLSRLEARAIRKPFQEFVRDTVIKQLEHFAGLR